MNSPRVYASTTFRSFRSRNYKLFFFGQGTSLIGTWMQTIALGWLVLELSDNSGVAVGLVIALQFLPMLLLGAWGGVVADRFDKRRIMFLTAAVQAAASAVLGLLVVADVVELWMVAVLVLVIGIAQAIDSPTRLAFLPEMVGFDDLSNAVALNSSIFHLARILGPALAGAIIVLAGTGLCFIVNGVSYVALLVALLAMDAKTLHPATPVAREKGQIREGLKYLWHTAELRWLMMLTTIVGVLAINYPVVLPLIAKLTFHGDAGTYSVITIAMGIPAMIGSLVVAHRSNLSEHFLVGSGLVFGAATIVAALAPSLAVFVVLIGAVGAGQVAFMASCNSMAQLRSDPRMRGRVMSIYLITVLGAMPIGGPLVGWISQQFGPRYGVALGGVATVLGVLVLGGLIVRARRATAADDRDHQTELALPALASSSTRS